jgi:hypothetical protein
MGISWMFNLSAGVLGILPYYDEDAEKKYHVKRGENPLLRYLHGNHLSLSF